MSHWKRIAIAQLEMRNFKRFYGRHVLDLLPEDSGRRPIILIGGNNNRGKTTIHEAINFALYEDDEFPGITSRTQYLGKVGDRLNRRALDESQTDYAVAIELIASSGAGDRRLRIERQWEVSLPDRKVLRSKLMISENGRPADWLEEAPGAFQDFLRNLLPPQVAPFFFFDGERIQEFADIGKGARLIEAIEDILHINVYKRLRDDLKRYVVDHVDATEVRSKKDGGDFFKLQEEAEGIEHLLEAKRERAADITREVEEKRRARKQVEDELRRLASPMSSSRDELHAQKARLDGEVEGIKSRVQQAFEPLPILLAGLPLLSALRESISVGASAQDSRERVDGLRRQLATLKREVFDDPSPAPPSNITLSSSQKTFYGAAFERAADRVFLHGGSQPAPPAARLHDLSQRERERVVQRLDAVTREATSLREAIDLRERLSGELREVTNKLNAASDDPHVIKLFDKNRKLAEEIGGLDTETRALKGEIQRLQAELAVKQRQVDAAREAREASSEAERVVKLAQKARRTLDEYMKRLAPEKLTVLRDRFEEMYDRLKKVDEDPVRSIDIDPESWQILLKDEKGRVLEREVFSAAMREIYALSLLWALAQASGKILPIVIDTPAGRLDTTNRRALFEKYLPHAGHQVIVLSTDTEIDVQWAERLRPYISRQYRLDYDPEHDSSVVRPGYFR